MGHSVPAQTHRVRRPRGAVGLDWNRWRLLARSARFREPWPRW